MSGRKKGRVEERMEGRKGWREKGRGKRGREKGRKEKVSQVLLNQIKNFIFPIIVQLTRHPQSPISWWHHRSPCCSGYMSQNHFYFTFHLLRLVDYQKLSSLSLKHISNYPLSSSPLLSNLVTAFRMLHLKHYMSFQDGFCFRPSLLPVFKF